MSAVRGQAQLPRDARGYPIIATVSREDTGADFGSLSERRKLALAAFDLCAVCGYPFGREVRWQVAMTPAVLASANALFSEAPVHEICALYAAQVCPFVSSPFARLGDEWWRGQRRPDTVYLVGYSRTATVSGHRSGLQTTASVLHFDMADRVSVHMFQSAADAASVYEQAMREDCLPDIDQGESALVDVLNRLTPEGEDSGGVIAGAAWYVGAAFCPGIRQVQGMEVYTSRGGYDSIARAILQNAQLANEMVDVPDAATGAAMLWFTTRAKLPDVLGRWRRKAQRSSGTDGIPVSPAEQRKARRKTAAASRRKNRR